ncbi:MAG: sulfatase-like hydrolase/transferase [Gemmataceae bacterium]
MIWLLCGLLAAADSKLPPRPNILWLTCEDISPNLGCYGDKDAKTPNLDAFAKTGTRYTNAFSVSGVCAPSRSALIMGMYPSTLGSHFMRCKAPLPAGVTTFTKYLREAGYYCTNNVKQDYNLAVTPKDAWDESSNKAHWKNRPKDKPFFAVFNNTVTHESQIRASEEQHKKNTAMLTDEQRHDYKKVFLPPFHPNSVFARQDWARYHDLISAMDHWFGEKLKELDEAGLADDTIVFFFSDHGVGLPRGKRWLYDTGMRVPLIIRVGRRYADYRPTKPGDETDRLVSFVDFGPTVLALAGVEIPETMQGQPFLGKVPPPEREAVYGIRDRMDERIDTTRAVRDKRFKYIRNYQWFRPWAQPIAYMEQMPTMKAYRSFAEKKALTREAALWMAPTKPYEELYDVQADPFELKNLADDPRFLRELQRLRALHHRWYRETRDLGLIPESILYERAQGRTPYELGQNQKLANSLELRLAVDKITPNTPLAELRKMRSSDDEAIRWWAITALGVLGFSDAQKDLEESLTDRSPSLRVAAALALHQIGQQNQVLETLQVALKDTNPWVRHQAALALDEMGKAALPALESLREARLDKNEYVVRVVETILNRLDPEADNKSSEKDKKKAATKDTNQAAK